MIKLYIGCYIMFLHVIIIITDNTSWRKDAHLLASPHGCNAQTHAGRVVVWRVRLPRVGVRVRVRGMGSNRGRARFRVKG